MRLLEPRRSPGGLRLRIQLDRLTRVSRCAWSPALSRPRRPDPPAQRDRSRRHPLRVHQSGDGQEGSRRADRPGLPPPWATRRRCCWPIAADAWVHPRDDKAGISICVDDMDRCLRDKERFISEANGEVLEIENQYLDGLITTASATTRSSTSGREATEKIAGQLLMRISAWTRSVTT